MELDDLEDLFDELDIDGPTPDQLYTMYGIFLNDFDENPILLKGKTLKYNRSRSKHPVCLGKAQAFEHIITRKSKISGKRNFDRQRANKIHWIRPILINAHDIRIKYFERVNDKGVNQHFYWYQEKSFIIIIREIDPDVLLITSYSVDSLERNNFKQWYDDYRN